mmetsp:Transcript_5387/g.11848  ORF Transcript_5387/g.11848 Transcript_5387/m.11848 type:complete len:312 (-) Transcript_5387:963-1898(-)
MLFAIKCVHHGCVHVRPDPLICLHLHLLLIILSRQPVVLDLGVLLPVCQAGKLPSLGTHGEWITVLKAEELVQVEQSVEEECRLGLGALQIPDGVGTLHLWLQHVMQLAHHVLKQHWLLGQVLQSLELLLVEVPHLTRADHTVAVQVHALEPVLHGRVRCLVLLTEDEPHKVLVPHLPRLLAGEAPRHLFKYPVDDEVGKCTLPVVGQVALVQQEVVIRVQLPKLAVDDVEVLVAEELEHLVDVVLLVQKVQCLNELPPPHLTQCQLPATRPIEGVEYPQDHGFCILLLELRRLVQELQTRVVLQDALHEW